MQLTYRDIQYNTAPAFTTAESSGLTVIYRELSYTARATDAKVMPIQALMYRGIVPEETQIRHQPIVQ